MPYVKGTAVERFLSRIEVAPDGCWIWQGSINNWGYGSICDRRRRVFVHRFAWETWRGPIPDRYVVDHLCRETRCCNPDHLEPVTHRENILRGPGPSALTHRTGVCRRGHSMADAQTVRRSDGRVRHLCRTCRHLRDSRRAAALRDAS